MVALLLAFVPMKVPTFVNLQICLELHRTQAVDLLRTFKFIRKCSWYVLNWPCVFHEAQKYSKLDKVVECFGAHCSNDSRTVSIFMTIYIKQCT